jgi:hypothetical protein
MSQEVIKSFLVGLGFDIDESGLAKFNRSVENASVKVLALSTAIEATATAIAYGISDIAQSFEKMGYEYRIIAPAINKALILRRELLKAYSQAGINLTQVIQSSVKLNMSLAKTGFAFKALYDSVGSRFFGLITKQSDLFRQRLYKIMPQIQKFLENFVNGIFRAFSILTQIGERLVEIITPIYNQFVELHQATDGLSTAILGLAAAFGILDLEFLVSPIGLVIAGLTALFLLYDDFKTAQQGGESLFNWKPFIPVIDAVIDTFKDLKAILSDVFEIIFAISDAVIKLIHLDFSGFWNAIKLGAESAWNALGKLGSLLYDILHLSGGLIQWSSDVFGQSTPQTVTPTTAPLYPLGAGSGVLAPQNNQNVSQQTTINVTGTSNADMIGKAVAGQQNAVNFNLSRNLKGAIAPK